MNTLEQIKQEFAVEAAAIDADAPFAGYDLDSLTLADIFAIEDELHVQVLDEAAGSVAALRAVALLVDSLMAGNRG
jgi:acyl carrier protein